MIELPKSRRIAHPNVLVQGGAPPPRAELKTPPCPATQAPGLMDKARVQEQLTVASNADAAFVQTYGAHEAARQAQAVKEVLADIAEHLPVEVPRSAKVLEAYPDAQPLQVRAALTNNPVVIHHKVDPDTGIHTHVFLGYGPEDDGDYDGKGPGATQPYNPETNPGGVKYNMTHKFAQACELLQHFQQLQRQGIHQLAGIDVGQAIDGMKTFLVSIVRHELIHCEQYRMGAVMDIDHDFDAHSQDGLPSDELIDAARAEVLYENEAFHDEEQHAHSIGAGPAVRAAEALRKHLQDNGPSKKMFREGGRFEFLADGRDNEFGSYYLLYLAESAENFDPAKPYEFTGTLKMFMNGMHEPAEAFRDLRHANDAFESGLSGGEVSAQALLQQLGATSKTWAEYFDQGDKTRRMQSARPHLFKLEKGFEAELQRSQQLAGKAAEQGLIDAPLAAKITGQWRDHL